MKKVIVSLILILSMAILLTACSGNSGNDYDMGSGTASRAEISYPDPEPSGMQFEDNLVISGNWTIVSNPS